MAFGNNYNNNDRGPVNITYSAIGFSNPNGVAAQSKLNISYYNKLLKIGIAKKNPSNNNGYDTYDNDNQAVTYISTTKARILSELITKLKKNENDDLFNVSIEVKNGVVRVADGIEFGCDAYFIVINSVDDTGEVNTALYYTKKVYHKGIENYSIETNEYNEEYFDIELDAFQSVLDEYVKASTYAVAASIMEASMYKRNALSDVIYNIGRKAGVVSDNNGNGNRSSNSNSSFLSRNNNSGSHSNNGGHNGLENKGFETSTLDDMI